MEKTNRYAYKSKVIAYIIAFILVIFPAKTNTYAVYAPSTFSTGHITYSSGVYNIGDYSTTLSASVSSWNTSISSYYVYNNHDCEDNVSLSSVSSGDVIVSYTSSYPSYDVLGRVSLWAHNGDGEAFTLDLTNGAQWEYGFLYVYPAHIIALVNQMQGFSTSDIPDCIKHTTVHEFGHILGLMHAAYGQNDSVMKSGLSTNHTPSSYDLDDIHYQWCIRHSN